MFSGRLQNQLPNKMRASIYIVCLAVTACSVISLSAQSSVTPDEKIAAYNKVIAERSHKIVANLGISDSVSFSHIQDIISTEYTNLGRVHDSANTAVKRVKASGAEKTAQDQQVKIIEETRAAKLQQLHTGFLAALGQELSAEQVVAVKDGMTYNILPVTYKAYQEMILTLTEVQRKQIYAWLEEAREMAMDAESSEKKHAWFGKYKGRINNYLSAAGYNMKKEGEEWQKRIAAKKNS